MPALLRNACPGAIAATLLLFAAAPVSAQDQGAITREEVTGFLDNIEQEVAGWLEAGDYERLTEWAERTVADEAQFYAQLDVQAGDERKGTSFVTVDKQDVLQLGGIIVAMLGGGRKQGLTIADYTLSTEVREVVPAGTDAATVDATFAETFTFSAPPAEAGTDTATEGQSVAIAAEADCHMLIRRNGPDQLVFGLTACTGSIRQQR